MKSLHEREHLCVHTCVHGYTHTGMRMHTHAHCGADLLTQLWLLQLQAGRLSANGFASLCLRLLRGPRRRSGDLLPPRLGEDEGSGTANPFAGHLPGAESRARCYVAVAAFRSCAFSGPAEASAPHLFSHRVCPEWGSAHAPFPDELREAGRGEALLSRKGRGQGLNPVLSGFHA